MKITIPKPQVWRSLVSLAAILQFMFSLAACSGGGSSAGGNSAAVVVTVSPDTASVVAGLSIPLTVTVSGTATTPVTWSVNNVAGGNATLGTVDASGIYTAPLSKSSPALVTVTATSVVDTSKSASANITINSLTLAGAGGGYSGIFSIATAMKSARSNHSATLLASGNVLVTGGIGATGAPIADAELFQPDISSFSSASAMTTPRAYHTATLLQNGKVLVAGGFDDNNNALARAELFDPSSGTFTATGSMTVPRAYHTATLLLDGKILIVGGNATSDLTAGEPLASIELFDPATGTFTSPPATVMTDGRYYHTATLLKNGTVLLAGGIGTGGIKHAMAELYDPSSAASNKISTTAPMSSGRWLHSATLMNDGRVLIGGGSSGTIAGGLPAVSYLAAVEIFDPVAGSFSAPASQLIDTRGFFTTTLLADTTVLSAGGFGLKAPAQTGSSLATAEIFNANGGGSGISTSASTGAMSLQRANHTATLLPSSGKVLVLGGGGYSTGIFEVTNSAQFYQ